MCIKAQRGNTRGSSDQMSRGAVLKKKSRNKRSCINLQGCDSWEDILTLTALLEIAFLADNTKKGDQTMSALFYCKITMQRTTGNMPETANCKQDEPLSGSKINVFLKCVLKQTLFT